MLPFGGIVVVRVSVVVLCDSNASVLERATEIVVFDERGA